MGYPAFAGNAPESYAQLILSTLFGGSMSSRLFQSIRERNGLAYSVYSYVNVYSGAGEMELYAGTSPETAQQVADLMGAEVRKLLREGNRPGRVRKGAPERADLLCHGPGEQYLAHARQRQRPAALQHDALF